MATNRILCCRCVLLALSSRFLQVLTMADTCADQPSRILFGSCNSQAYAQPLWPAILARNASVWVWAGDAIYSDPVIGHDFSTFPPKTIIDHPTPQRLHDLYQAQKQHEGYKELLEHHTLYHGNMG